MTTIRQALAVLGGCLARLPGGIALSARTARLLCRCTDLRQATRNPAVTRIPPPSHCPMHAADGAPCPMHQSGHHDAEDKPNDKCSMRGTCDGPMAALFALLSNHGVLRDSIILLPDLHTGSAATPDTRESDQSSRVSRSSTPARVNVSLFAARGTRVPRDRWCSLRGWFPCLSCVVSVAFEVCESSGSRELRACVGPCSRCSAIG